MSAIKSVFENGLTQVQDRVGVMVMILSPDNHMTCFYPFEECPSDDILFHAITYDVIQYLVENGFMTHSSGKYVIADRLSDH